MSRTVEEAGWAYPALAKKAHYFTTEGRALCGRWLYTGERDSNQTTLDHPGPDDCTVCFRKAKKLPEAPK